MTIQYYRKNVYGKTLYYIADKTLTETWQTITGKKTITEWDIIACKTLFGVKFEEVTAPKN